MTSDALPDGHVAFVTDSASHKPMLLARGDIDPTSTGVDAVVPEPDVGRLVLTLGAQPSPTHATAPIKGECLLHPIGNAHQPTFGCERSSMRRLWRNSSMMSGSMRMTV